MDPAALGQCRCQNPADLRKGPPPGQRRLHSDWRKHQGDIRGKRAKERRVPGPQQVIHSHEKMVNTP